MILKAKITLISEPESVTFRDGTQHRCQNIWLNYRGGTDLNPDNWNTILTLWDSNIEQFAAIGYKLDDLMDIDITLGYKKNQWQGREVYSRDVQIRSVILTQQKTANTYDPS